jgi:toxin ParE1/3/4
MLSPKSVRLGRKAEEDLSDVFAYSVGQWGIKRADAYLKSLQEVIDMLPDLAKFGKNRPHVPHGYLIYPAEKHFLVYKISKKDIFVARIVHQKMFIAQHL